MTLTRIIAVAYITASSLAAGQLRTDSSTPRDWGAWLAREAPNFNGVAVAGRDGKIDAEVAMGLADASVGRRNRTDTRFNLGSINKTFTAIAIAQLAEQRRLSIDDRLIQHVPDYPNREAAERITIRQLLRHTSGVAQFMRADFGDVTVPQMVRVVAAEPMAFEPGARQVYSNGGYVLLGRVIETVSGRTYNDYIQEHIYRRAGMTASGFVRPDTRFDGLALPGGADSAAGSQPAAPRPGNPAGGGYSTAADLFRFAHALRTGRLLGPEMTRYVIDGTFAEDPRWGFSLREQRVGDRRFLGNGGGAPGVNAEFRFDATGGDIVVVLSNASPPAATNLLALMLNRIAGITAQAR